ncbi:MAG: acetyl/propionyl/methylcrotonyl-CoA carboxylase subunit alpha [Bradymonadaceae bacterium]
MFDKVLVANRGEIAVRVMRTLKEMGIETVGVYSQPDRQSLHVRYADEAYCVGPAPSSESYLDIERILEVAHESGAEAIHPGYGFLSENPEFSQACRDAGVKFIGPYAKSIEAMGEKTGARTLMREADVPVVPGNQNPVSSVEEGREIAESMEFPVLVKAAAGGGGKGMRRVDEPAQFEAAFEGARREAINSFGNGDLYVEKYVVNPKHVEIQILLDEHGNGVHLFERECSVQRRHQKIIEETPCPVLEEETRREMGEVALRAAEAVDYVGAGTVEFLLDADQNFYFLEMNTRLQVEHPITEALTGLDLVRWQVEVAADRELPFEQEDLDRRGAAIECRIYAEDPDQDFMPTPGDIAFVREPSDPGVRVDSGVYTGSTIPKHYDPLVSKLVTWGGDREHAIRRMRRCLDEYVVSGLTTNLDFHEEVLEHPDFLDGTYDTEFVPDYMEQRDADTEAELDGEVAEIAAVLAAHRRAEQLKREASSDGQSSGGDGERWKRYGRFRQLGR